MRRPVWLGGHSSSELYIEPDVLRPVASKNSAGAGDDTGSAAWRSEDEAEVRDLDEAFGSTRLAEKEQRVSWVELVKKEVLRTGPLAWRYVLLGPPGQGKSQLLRMTARQISLLAGQLFEQDNPSTAEVPLAAVVSLRELVRAPEGDSTPDQELQQALHWVLRREGCPPEAAAQYLRAARSRRGWLLLDGLDEVPATEQERLAQLLAPLTDISRWPCNVIVTSRSTELWQGRLPFKAEQVLRLAPLSDAQVASYIGRRLSSTARSMADLIRQSPALVALSRSPFLLSMMCWLAQEGRLSGKSTRSQIYDTLFARLLSVSREGGNGEEQARRGRRFLRVLAKIAWKSFGRDTGRMSLREGELYAALKAEGLIPANGGDDLLGELLRQRVLVPLEPESAEYMFPHRSLLEYLAGWYFADQVNEAGWQVELDVGTKQVPAVTLVDRKSWDPGWEQVLLFAAGQLQEPLPLLTRLADPRPTPTNPFGDDVFRHRLGLAARCLAEIGNSKRESPELAQLIDRITTELWRLWCEHQRDWGCVNEQLSRSFPQLAICNGRVDGKPLMQIIADGVAGASDAVRKLTLRPIACMGPAAASEEWIAQLAAMLDDLRFAVRVAATDAVGYLGPSAADQSILQPLSKMLSDSDSRRTAVSALTRVGTNAAYETVLSKFPDLVAGYDSEILWHVSTILSTLNMQARQKLLAPYYDMLCSDDRNRQLTALETLARIGPHAATEPSLTSIAELLASNDVREAAMHTVWRLSPASATQPILAQLGHLLMEHDQDTRASAARLVGDIGESATTETILNRLADLLIVDADLFENWLARDAAIGAIYNLGSAAATQAIVERVAALLFDNEPSMRQKAAMLLGRLGKVPDRSDIFNRLIALLDDTDSKVNCSAAYALCRLYPEQNAMALERLATLLKGKDIYARNSVGFVVRDICARNQALITETFLARVVELIGHHEEDIARDAVQVITLLEGFTFSVGFYEHLAQLLSVKNHHSQIGGLRAIGAMGAAAAVDSVLMQLPALLMHGDKGIRYSAAAAVRRVGPASATTDVLAAITKLIDDEDRDVRHEAVLAVREIGKKAATPSVLLRLYTCLSSDDEWLARSAEEAIYKMTTEGIRVFRVSEAPTEYIVRGVGELGRSDSSLS